METTSIFQDRKNMFSHIAGKWYAESLSQTWTFSTCNLLSQEVPLSISDKNKKLEDNVYAVSTFIDDKLQPFFYIETGKVWDHKRWYKIKEISATKMVLIEIEKAIGRKEMGNAISYTKTVSK